jgi:hypothetical protein
MVTITVTFDPDSQQDRTRVHALIRGFDDVHAAPDPGPGLGPAGSQNVFAAAAADLLHRTGPNLQELLRASAGMKVFTMASLADKLGRSPSSTRSLFANLGRSVNAMHDAVPGAPKLHLDEKINGVWHFNMAEGYRKPILGNFPGA